MNSIEWSVFMSIPSTDRLSFTCPSTNIKAKILELHANDWYIVSLNPTTDLKVRIVAKKLVVGMVSQSYHDLDLRDFWFRFSQMRDFKIQECKVSPGSEK